VRLRVRLESQLAQVIEAIGTMQQNIVTIQQNMATKQDLAVVRQDVTAVHNNVNALREDVISLRHRIDSVEGAVSIVIRNTFTVHQNIELQLHPTGLTKKCTVY
jgi:ACT domain-containing protein